jgi:hypothetical protein
MGHAYTNDIFGGNQDETTLDFDDHGSGSNF